jgi:hypothetical protein
VHPQVGLPLQEAARCLRDPGHVEHRCGGLAELHNDVAALQQALRVPGEAALSLSNAIVACHP